MTIDKKVNKNIELSLDELKFLYEIDNEIEGFGYEKDPRIQEIKNKRDQKNDCLLIFNVKESEVALSQNEWESNPKRFKVLLGNLEINKSNSSCLYSPPTLSFKSFNTQSYERNISMLYSNISNFSAPTI